MRGEDNSDNSAKENRCVLNFFKYESKHFLIKVFQLSLLENVVIKYIKFLFSFCSVTGFKGKFVILLEDFARLLPTE